MPAERALQIATYLLVADSVAALYLSGLLGPPGVVLTSAALAAAWHHCWLRKRLGMRGRLDTPLIVIVALAAVLDLVYFADSLLVGFVHLLVVLVVLRLFTSRSARDLRDAGLVSFFILVGSSAVGFGVEFLFVFVTFLPIGTWMLVLSHLVTESQRASPSSRATPTRVGLSAGLLSLSAIASLATLLVTAGLFLVIPRVGEATLAMGVGFRRMVSGFSESVRLGAIGEIESDATVIMRVRLPQGTPVPETLSVRWRGIALDYFDGGGWQVSRPERVAVPPSAPDTFAIAAPRSTGRILRQEVMLEPIGTDVIFAARRALRAIVRGSALMMDDQGALVVPNPAARVEYVIESELEDSPGRPLAASLAPAPLDEATRARYLQLPPISPRIPALAQQTRGTREPYEAALALSGFFSHDFRYTLNLKRTSSLDPLDEFLFVSRAGNCEYFAASLAVMLRSVGIPARVVNGFQRGEWNPYGGYFVVRLRDAHAWVEAYVEHLGWITLDPSPRADMSTRPPADGMSLYLDVIRMHLDTLRNRWHRYVVTWGRQDQVDAATTMRRTVSRLRLPLPSWRTWADARGAVGLALAFVAGLVAWAWWHRPGSASPWRGPTIPTFYRRALRTLARAGLRVETGETAREFSARVEAGLPAAAKTFAQITAAYERVRFGFTALGHDEVTQLQTSITRLEAERKEPRTITARAARPDRSRAR